MLRSPIDAGRMAIAAGIVTVALAGCGGGDEEARAPETTPPTITSTTTAVTTPEIPDLPAPDTAVLQDTLVRFVDPTVPAPEKAALVVAGEKYIPQIETMNGGLANYGRITFSVDSVEVDGTTAVALVDVTTPYTPTIPMSNLSWDNVDGVWKISETTVCNLLAFGQASCVPSPPA